jgi:hypothetical protein
VAQHLSFFRLYQIHRRKGRLLTQLRCNQSRALFNLGYRKRTKGMYGHAVSPNYLLRIYVFDFQKLSRAQINKIREV